MEAMKGSVTSKDLNLLSEQLGKDAVTRVHRLAELFAITQNWHLDAGWNWKINVCRESWKQRRHSA